MVSAKVKQLLLQEKAMPRSQGPSSSWSWLSSSWATAMEIWWLPLWSKSQSFPAVVRKKR
jgi:hypothetical protein